MRLLLPFLLLAALSIAQPSRLTPDQAADIEKSLAADPDNLTLRTQLLSYYYSPSPGQAAIEARRRHILWLIEHHPDSPILASPAGAIVERGNRLADSEGFLAVQKLWRQQASKEDASPVVIARAAEVFDLSDRPFSLQLIAQGLKRFPNDRELAEMEGMLDAFSLTGVSAFMLSGVGLQGPALMGPATAFSGDPDSPDARRAREELRSTNNPAILSAAARSLGSLLSGFRRSKPDLAPPLLQLAEQSFQKAAKLTPDDEKLQTAFASFYVSVAAGTIERAEKVRLLEAGLTHAHTPDSRQNCLEWLCAAHFENGNTEAAAREATELLALAAAQPQSGPLSSRYATGTHEANIILGRVALKNGDVKEASARLIAAAKVPGSPTLNSFGPKWTLAKELIDHGERDVVLEYITLCGAFWKSGGARLQRWSAAIREGAAPNFSFTAAPIQDLTGKTAAPFQLTDLTATERTLESYKGKIVLLDFWATWCGPCRLELPSFEKLHKEFAGQEIVILTVDVGESRETVEAFMREQKYTFPVLLGEDRQVAEKYAVVAFPTTVVIDPTGRIADYHVGVQEELAIRAAIEKAKPPHQ